MGNKVIVTEKTVPVCDKCGFTLISVDSKGNREYTEDGYPYHYGNIITVKPYAYNSRGLLNGNEIKFELCDGCLKNMLSMLPKAGEGGSGE